MLDNKSQLRIIPDAPIGYEIYRYAVSILRPEATTNLLLNPQMFLQGTTDNEPRYYDRIIAANTSIARTEDSQRRGPYGCEVSEQAPASGLAIGVYQTISLTADEDYTFSCDVYGGKEYTFRIYFADNAGNRVSPYTSFAGRGFWTRQSITYRPPSTADYRVYLQRDALDAGVNNDAYYTDGWQVENKAYATSYVDGELVGFVRNQEAFGWNGDAHKSTSFRIEETRAGGREIFLTDADIYFRTNAIIGLGHPPIDNISIDSQLGGAFYQNTITEPRTFSLVGQFIGNNDGLKSLHRARASFIDIVRFNYTTIPQPLVMRYRLVDECEVNQTEDYEIICLYNSGLGGNINNYYQEKLSVSFVEYIPGLTAVTENGQELEYFDTLSDVNYILKFSDDTDGWDNMNTGANGDVYVIKQNPVDKKLYIGGNFTSIGGVAANYVASYDPSTDTFAALDVGMDNYVNDLDFRTDGQVAFAGNFTTAGGVASNYFAIWDPNTSAWLGVAGNPGGETYSVAVSKVTVNFVAWVGLVVNTGGINYDLVMTTSTGGNTWAADLTGTSATGFRPTTRVVIQPGAASSLTEELYSATSFLDGSGDTISRIRRRRLAPGYGLVGEFFSTGAKDGITAMEFDDNGNLYIGGTIESNNLTGDVLNAVAKYNGTAWFSMGDGLEDTTAVAVNDFVYANGNLYAVGDFDSSGSITFASPVAFWNGSEWNPGVGSGNFPGTPELFTIEVLGDDLYIGFDTTGSAIVSAFNVVTSDTRSPVYPIIEYKGPLTVYNTLRNASGIQYAPLVLSSDQKATLDLSPYNFSFIDEAGNNLQYFIRNGSREDLLLLKNGVNNISIYADNYYYEEGDDNNQLTGYDGLTGISSYSTDNGKLYFALRSLGAGNYSLTIYRDAGLTFSVGRVDPTPFSTTGVKTVVSTTSTGFGVSGTINVGALVGTDTDIVVTFGLIRMRWRDSALSIDELVL